MSSYQLIDGKKIAANVRADLGPRIETLKNNGVIPGLAVILIGEDPASQAYVGMKEKAFAEMGLRSHTWRLPAETAQDDVLNLISELNADPGYHGILVQLPVPAHLDSLKIIESISPEKDADGIHPMNMGRMVLGIEAPLSCTPHGILMLLKYSGINTSGKHIVVIGRSNIVGKPIANMLVQKSQTGNATVTMCHSRTNKLPEICRQADILIASIGSPELITADYVREGAVVIDVGVNRVDDASRKRGYRLTGDVKFDEVAPKTSAITPVPGGVGPMTISMLLYNTVYLAEKAGK